MYSLHADALHFGSVIRTALECQNSNLQKESLLTAAWPGELEDVHRKFLAMSDCLHPS
jgi:hypothetical protein